jgi:hypothetical protein
MSTAPDKERLVPAAGDGVVVPTPGDGNGQARAPLVEIFERLDRVADEGAEAHDEAIVDGREPVLTVPEELTPLPEVDRAMPTLALFGGVIVRKRARYKIAVLKTLQGDGAGRWKIRRLQEVIHWMEPHSVSEIAAELRAGGILDYDSVSGYYRLGAGGRMVAALLGALTVPEVEPRRLIKALNKAMSLSLALGASEDIVFAQFASAVSQLRADWEELKTLLDDFSRDALLTAAHLVQDHVEDMKELLAEHESFIAQRRADKLYLDVEQEALDLIFRLAEMAGAVIQAVSGRADELMRLGVHVDRGDLREFIGEVGAEAMAELLADLVAPAPFVVAVPAAVAFDSLEEAMGRKRATPPPLPAPTRLERRAPPPVEDKTAEIAGAAKELRLLTPLVDFVVQDSWAVSIARHAALIDAYSREEQMPGLEVDAGFDEPGRADVWRISRADLAPQRGRREDA